MVNVLCICSRNKLRSPTAEFVANQFDGVYADSAGLANDAVTVLSADQVREADIIFVMEKQHLKKLKSKYSKYINNKKIISLDIPDNYECMQPELIEILEKKLAPHLNNIQNKKDRKMKM
jgi:predicted protein tyrosine phosphatase